MVVGRGTSDPDANSSINKVARMLWEGWASAGARSAQRRHLPAGRARHSNMPVWATSASSSSISFTGIPVKRIYSITDEMAAKHPEIEFLEGRLSEQSSAGAPTPSPSGRRRF